MKLNKSLREDIVYEIINDLPKVDYEDQIRGFMQKDAKDQWPQELKDAVAKNPLVEGYLETCYKHAFRCTGGVRVSNNKYQPDTSDGSQLKRLHDAHESQLDSKNSIRIQIESAIAGCKTTEEFLNIFPEFGQYIERPDETIKNLPACKVVDEMKAVGWVPKKDKAK